MWPFTRSTDDPSLDDDINAAVHLAALEWRKFRATGHVPDNLGLHVQLGQFAHDFRPEMEKHFRSLRSAPSQLVLLIMAEGVAASGSASRNSIERQLKITLPDRPIIMPLDDERSDPA
ncbi:hypothetical protein HFP51_00850 [Parasphingopyxis sp. CP4]|uniref:hypothetical protein n=1 Tax=Parasphingopyxis sp. CP4 TaxID=2724527 RepID=UPI00159FCC88|nr:hypothetical protein [Parasphingopyxis sp. CP4]QLC20858.1 hypothetical protein HFP51_00850 [Parasphingopyxis sp. CP4]